MSAPTEPRRAEDVLQDAIAGHDVWYRDLFGPQESWSPAVVREYLLDLHLARQRATSWEIAS